MKYMMLMYASADEAPQYSPDEFQASVRDWQAFESEVKAAGVFVDFHGLNPVSDATSLRVRAPQYMKALSEVPEFQSIQAGSL